MISRNAMQGIIDLHDKASHIFILDDETIIDYPLNDYDYVVTKTQLLIQRCEGFKYEKVPLENIFTSFTKAQIEMFDRRWRYNANEM